MFLGFTLMDITKQPGSQVTTGLSNRASRPLPHVVSLLQGKIANELSDELQITFTTCDNLFFKLADRASSNNEQNMYFEAMREVRSQKNTIKSLFHAELTQVFNFITNNHPVRIQDNADSLSLVQTDELEKHVAITSIVSKARVECQEELYHFNRRIDPLFPDFGIDENNSPLDPRQICEAFASACKPLELDIKALIILYKQFETIVIGKLPSLLSRANQQLIDAGAQAKIEHEIARNTSPTSKPKERQETAIQPTGGQEFQHKFNELSQLLSSVRDIAMTGQLGFPLFVSDSTGPEIPQRELNGILSELQHENKEHLTGTGLLEPQIDIRTLLQQVVQQRKDVGKSTKVSKSDEDVINLVAMFFDFVLDDKQLPIHVQALISRLQIPVLKVSLKDRSFFNKAEHPVRKLINEIVAAGIGMLESETQSRNALFKKMTSIVHNIHDTYSEDEAVFERTLEELQEYRNKEENKAARIEKRTSETAEASAKTQHTKEMIKEMVLERLCDVQAPLQIQTFLIEDWQQVLFLAKIKFGTESSEWIEVIQVMDDLIWTALEHSDDKSRVRQQRIIPDLQSRLHRWLSTAKPSPQAIDSALEPIIKMQQQLLRADMVNMDRTTLNNQQQSALKPDQEFEKPWKEMTAVERQQVQYQALTYDFIKKVEELPLGTWVLFNKTADGSSLRCKLAAKIETNDHFVFVNRLGFKVMEKKRKEFALNMQQGKAKLLESTHFFDRMMHKVSDRLQTAAATPA